MTVAGQDSSLLRSALLHTGQWLQATGYEFVTVTPATHEIVLSHRAGQVARSVRDVFGWNLPFQREHGVLPEAVAQEMAGAGLLMVDEEGLWHSRVRFARLGQFLFPHSSFPTVGNQSVFFGPDTYRFAALIQRELKSVLWRAPPRILDVCCGTGAGGLVAGSGGVLWDAPQLTLADINPVALDFAHVSCELAGATPVTLQLGDLFGGVQGEMDVILANPPYLNDLAGRLYRHGGGRWGEQLSLRILREGLPHLAPGGRLILYTGSAIQNGVDALKDQARDFLQTHEVRWSYEELDPDVFGEELLGSAYADVDRIAAVGLVVRKP